MTAPHPEATDRGGIWTMLGTCHEAADVVCQMLEWHRRHDNPDAWCDAYSLSFDTPCGRVRDPRGPHWKVESLEPLTLSPSILCTACGFHGFIREGRWVPA